jgi:hypothetical protein
VFLLLQGKIKALIATAADLFLGGHTHFLVSLLLQGKIQGFGSGGPGEAARSSSGHYGGIGSSGSGNYGGGFRSSGSSGLAAAQQAASQLTHAAQQALGDGPIAQGLASAVNSLGGLLQPAGYGSRLNVSNQTCVMNCGVLLAAVAL